MSALVESPLQLLCAVEAHAAGHAGDSTHVLARDDVPALAASVEAVRALGLPKTLDVTLGRARHARGADDVWLVGDPFSGVFQSSLTRGGLPGRLTLVDDGLGTLDVARRLVAGEPMVRLAAPGGPLRSVLGALTTRRLRRLARERRVTVCTMLPLEADVVTDLEALGVDVVTHSFEWLASRPVGAARADGDRAVDAITEPTVVVGSGLVADRLVQADTYAAWLAGLAADGPVRYLPHRRHDPLVTALFDQLPGVRVDQPGAPVEIRLRELTADQRVVTLPSTSAVTLTRLLTPRGVAVQPHDVPDGWWTHRATLALRRHLGLAADLARAARVPQAARGVRPAPRGCDESWAMA